MPLDMDNEACRYADKVRALRQREYDNAALYTDNEAEQAAQNERSMQNFIPYFKQVSEKRHRNSSDSIIINWVRVLTPSLKKHAFYNLLINNILHLCVT